MKRRSKRQTALVAVATAAPLLMTLGPAGAAGAVWGTTGCNPVDSVPPLVTSLSMTPTTVDVRNGPKQIHVTATATDSSPPGQPVSGVSYLSALLYDGSGNDDPNYVEAFLTRTAGTAEDGTWTGDFTVPRWVTGGDAGSTWLLDSVYVTDKARNSNLYPTQQGYVIAPDDIAKTDWTKTVTVLSTPDTSTPKLTDFSFSPSAVDSTTDAQKVVVKAKAVDTGSGVHELRATFERNRRNIYVELSLVRGTPQKGTWKGTAVVRRWSGTGTWRPRVTIGDRLEHYRLYSAKGLKTHGWMSSLEVTSGSESKPPSLLDLDYAPKTVDVQTSDETVRIRPVELRDRKSGVQSAWMEFVDRYGIAHYRPNPMRRITGTAKHGVWSAKMPVDECYAEPGTFRTRLSVIDRAGNSRSYGAVQLRDMGLPSKLVVKATAQDLQPPGVDGDSYGNNSGPILVTFTEDVTGVTTESLQLYDAQTYEPALMSSMTCVDSAFQVVNCQSGPVHRVTMQPGPGATPDSYYYVYANQNGVDGQVRDLVGNPAPWDYSLGYASLTSS
jgi:hypothetical protein